jgi:hypothetical protein
LTTNNLGRGAESIIFVHVEIWENDLDFTLESCEVGL